MSRNITRFVAVGLLLAGSGLVLRANRAQAASDTASLVSRVVLATGAQAALPAVTPAVAANQTVVFAGGCFWGVQAVFQHTKGVITARSGYAGGDRSTAMYEEVGTGSTGHAESVLVTFDPSVVTYQTLMNIFFTVAHDPTQVNMQGPDHGTQYRSAIFTNSPEQLKETQDYIANLAKAKVFNRPIATEVKPLKGFYEAEKYHQDYATIHPDAPYIVVNDAPKVENLKKLFPTQYRPTIK
ncbi:MAG: peptide-methionine (S)-S-oxide reductase MsrA [Gemmatimonas sp.]